MIPRKRAGAVEQRRLGFTLKVVGIHAKSLSRGATRSDLCSRKTPWQQCGLI